ncbi:hypothetical protein LTS10_007457 [Elasticomyces elasticus]|nr:hypothetical protein LTS10_007457 [Elasticomyces elasticus]
MFRGLNSRRHTSSGGVNLSATTSRLCLYHLLYNAAVILEALALALTSIRLPCSADFMDKWTALETGLIEETGFAGFLRYEYEPSPLALRGRREQSIATSLIVQLGTREALIFCTEGMNNYITASSVCALSDSLVVRQKDRLDPQTMIDALNVGTDGITGRYESGFGLALLVKGLGITEEFMEHNGFETELPSLTKRSLADALKAVEPDADHTKYLIGWKKRAGVELKRTEQVKDIPEEDLEHRLKGINRPS